MINARCGVVGASWSQLALVCLTIDFDKVLEKDKLSSGCSLLVRIVPCGCGFPSSNPSSYGAYFLLAK